MQVHVENTPQNEFYIIYTYILETRKFIAFLLHAA
jgi:hypothetical protein